MRSFRRIIADEHPETGSESLLALDILLQGFLAIHGKERFFRREIETTPSFLADHGILQGNSQVKALTCIEVARLFRTKAIHGEYVHSEGEPQCPKDGGYFWFDECLPDIAQPWATHKDSGGFAALVKFGEVWDLVRDMYEGRNPAIPGDLPTLFLAAHEEYVQFAGQEEKTKRLRELEERRNALNHKRINNDFLNKLANVNHDLPLERRAENALAAWASIRSPDSSRQTGKLGAGSRTVEEARQAWPSIEREVRAFFNTTVPEMGFALTNRGGRLKSQLLDTDGCIDHISQFVRDFVDIATQSESVRRERLQSFLKALDTLHDGFSAMRYQEGARDLFGGHLEDASS